MSVVVVGVRSGTREAGPNMVARDPAGGCEGVILSSSKSISNSIDAGIGTGDGFVSVVSGIGAFVGIDTGTGIGTVAVIGTFGGFD